MIQYILKQRLKDGELWASPVFEASELRHVRQAVLAGWINGEPRWAERPTGERLFGVDAKGKPCDT